MELFSEKFKALAMKYLDADNLFIGTISKVYSDEFTEAVKKRKDVVIVDIASDNREEKRRFIKRLMWKVKKAEKYVSEPESFKFVDGEIKMKAKHGEKTLKQKNCEWNCDCNFFVENHLCSHSIAVSKLYSVK